MRHKVNQILVFLLLLSTLLNVQLVYAQQPVVRAVLFYSPTCPHCHIVINEVLPPLVKQYGTQLDILGIDVSTEVGLNLYQSAILRYNIPEDRLGVPTMIVGDTILVGSAEIPQSFPGLIEAGLAAGGVDLPDIPGLKEIMANQPQPSANPSSAQEDPPVEQDASETGMIGIFMQDPVANSVAVVVLLGMFASIIAVGYSYVKGDESKFLRWPNWIVPVLALVGMGVAAYLSYVEITGAEAVCGPVGDCNSVQESRYAYLFGVISVGTMGLIGYALVLAAWIFRQYGPKSWDKPFSLAIWGMAWFGVLFSIYLTFLEPFVIGATCAWCITSAILITLILLASTERAKQALQIEEDEEEKYEDDEEQPGQAVAEGAESL